MASIVIAEDNIGFLDMLDLSLSAIPEFSIVSKAKDGYEVLDALRNAETGVDVLVMDAIMPKLDGIAVLEALNQGDIKKPTVILSIPAKNDYIAFKASQLDVSAVFIKPMNMAVLIEKIHQLTEKHKGGGTDYILSADDNNNQQVERMVVNIMQEIGILPHIQGYQFLKEGILYILEDINYLTCVTTKLYPLIAEKYHSKPARVERAMRHAIETAWNKGNVDTINKYFGYSTSDYRGKPTNSEFIAMIANWVQLRS
ncbi:MAG: sporulation transcription factor Spo0A [Christensenellales bacterium]|jgi:two-component system response regulator (stage 0 sporulation protein A)